MKLAHRKSDMERLGVFMEMSYISAGDKYTSANSHDPFNGSAYRSRQMQTGVTKQPCALQSGFFNKSFKRILRKKNRMQQVKKNLGKAFLPCSGTKKLPLTVPKKAQRSPGRSILISPPKKGSGYSYPNVTLSKMDLYVSDPYVRAKEAHKREGAIHHSKLRDGPFRINLHPQDYFQVNPYRNHKALPPAQKPPQPQKNVSTVPFIPRTPSKRIGGMKAETFDIYPSHSADTYVIHRSKPVNQQPVFRPAPGPKSTPVKNIISVNVDRLNNIQYSTRPSFF
uniref:Cilia-and flagella-associated protein 96 n=1 Tax=Poecilia latipinna TaxID=48699 RepID=A0A3B3UZH6_9TELE